MSHRLRTVAGGITRYPLLITRYFWRLVRRLRQIVPSSHYALLALLFFFGLEIIFALQVWIWFTVALLLILITMGTMLLKAEEGWRFHPVQVILPVLAAAGLLGFALFLPHTSFLHVYFLLAAVALFTLLKLGARQAYPTWNWGLSVLVLYLLLATIFGWHFHLYIPLLLVLVLTLVITFLVALQAFYRSVKRISEAMLLGLTLAFVLTQITWVLQFLPLHFLVQAAVVVILYYVAFHLISLSYERALTRKDVLEYGSVGMIALLLVLTTVLQA